MICIKSLNVGQGLNVHFVKIPINEAIKHEMNCCLLWDDYRYKVETPIMIIIYKIVSGAR